MASGTTTRMLSVCVLLLSSAANAAMLTEVPTRPFSPDRLLTSPERQTDDERQTTDWTWQFLADWAGQPSGTTGGGRDQSGPTWFPVQTPVGPWGDHGPPPVFDLWPRLGGLGPYTGGGAFDCSTDQVSPVPLPPALWLFGSGAAVVMPLLRRRTRRTRRTSAPTV